MNEYSEQLEAGCRVAFAALMHDVGKLYQRTGLPQQHAHWEEHLSIYCPLQKAGYYSHQHAAATALAYDEFENLLPDTKSQHAPFAPHHRVSKDSPLEDSLVNVAALHHKPNTFLQWCIAAADRAASGLDRQQFDEYNKAEDRRDDYLCKRLMVSFEELERPLDRAYHHEYPLLPLNINALYPVQRQNGLQRQNEYGHLWEHFLDNLRLIPKSHRLSWPLWLSHFEEAWLSTAHAIPSATAFGTRPDVSLYDHSKVTAALAVALWRWHSDQQHDAEHALTTLKLGTNDDTKKFLFIQGDFCGIQNFIFGQKATTQKAAAKLLRGRSAYVTLLTELAALRVLESLELPISAQIMNAAGKFTIIAPNTEEVRTNLEQTQKDLDGWFLEHTFGLTSVVLASCPASCSDLRQENYPVLRGRLGRSLEYAKLQRFDITSSDFPSICNADYSQGACAFDGRLPAQTTYDGKPCAWLTRDLIHLGKNLTDSHDNVLAIVSKKFSVSNALHSDVFGYAVAFLSRSEANERNIAGRLYRCYDTALTTADAEQPFFRGYARRAIMAYVPRHTSDPHQNPLYALDDDEQSQRGEMKTFEHLAVDALSLDADNKPQGVAALGVLKGDVDNLGLLFAGLQAGKASLSHVVEMSRRLSAFFSDIVPYICQKRPEFSDIYTLFAGGDDFYFLGPWHQVKTFAFALRNEFAKYTTYNPSVTFSAGYIMVKPHHPIAALNALVEDALAVAKAYKAANDTQPRKNAFATGDRSMSWDAMPDYLLLQDKVTNCRLAKSFSTGYWYDLYLISKKACGQANGERQRLSDNLWRSQLYYRTRRHLYKINHEQFQEWLTIIEEPLRKQPALLKDIFQDKLYRQRAATIKRRIAS